MILETIKECFAEPMDVGFITGISVFVYLILTALFLRVLGFNRGRDDGMESEGQRDLGQPRAGTSFRPRTNTNHEMSSKISSSQTKIPEAQPKVGEML